MQIFIFDNVSNTLQIDDYSILLIKEFKDLWDKERNKCKEDKTGEKRLRAYKEFTYIYLVLDFKSPYFKSPIKDRQEAAIIDSGLTDKELEDPVFAAAYKKYEELQDADPILTSIKVAYRTLYKFQVYLDNIDFTETDVDGKPIHKAKDILDSIKQISVMRTTLQELEQIHKTDLAAESKIRGDVEQGLFD